MRASQIAWAEWVAAIGRFITLLSKRSLRGELATMAWPAKTQTRAAVASEASNGAAAAIRHDRRPSAQR